MITFTVDPEKRRRTATLEGEITEGELAHSYSRLLTDPDYDPDLDDLIDLTRTSHFDVSADSVRRLMTLLEPIHHRGERTRMAIVAASDLTFGMSRMYEMLRGPDAPGQVRVFRAHEDAVAWLDRGGAPASAAPSADLPSTFDLGRSQP